MDKVKEVMNQALITDTAGAPFAFGGHANMLPLTFLTVPSISPDPIQLPPTDHDLHQLRSAMQPAPFGRGEDTLHDTAVRDCLQLDATLFHLSTAFNSAIADLAERCAGKLEVQCAARPVTAAPYKLVLYGPGGHFLPHKDTEKEAGMFATLVVQLPSVFTGGELHLHHAGRMEIFDFSACSETDAHFAAFYADCKHEVKTVATGHRLCLIFNLVRAPAGGSGSARKGNVRADQRLVSAARNWVKVLHKDGNRDEATKLLIPLEHEYTSENLSIAALKGRDAKVAVKLQDSDEFAFGIMLIEKMQKGEYDYTKVRYDPYGELSEQPEEPSRTESPPQQPDSLPDLEPPVYMGDIEQYMIERMMYEREMANREGLEDEGFGEDYGVDSDARHKITFLVGEDINVLAWHADRSVPYDFEASKLTLDIEQIALRDDVVFFGKQPAHEDYLGYTGNEGATAQHWYRSAALLVWPRAASFRVWFESDPAAATSRLEAMVSEGDTAQATSALTDAIKLVPKSDKTKYPTVLALLRVAMALRSAPFISDALELMRHSQESSSHTGRPGLSVFMQGEEQKAAANLCGVASPEAAETLCRLIHVCDSSLFGSGPTGPDEIARAVAGAIFETELAGLPFLVDLVHRIEHGMVTFSGVQFDLADVIISAAAQRAAETCDFLTAVRDCEVRDLACRVEPRFVDRMLVQLEKDEPEFISGRKALEPGALVEAAGSFVCSGGPLIWAVVEKVVREYMVPSRFDKKHSSSAHKLWTGLLQYHRRGEQIPGCDGNRTRARDMAKLMLSVATKEGAGEEPLCSMVCKDVRDSICELDEAGVRLLKRAMVARLGVLRNLSTPKQTWEFKSLGEQLWSRDNRVRKFICSVERRTVIRGHGVFRGIDDARSFVELSVFATNRSHTKGALMWEKIGNATIGSFTARAGGRGRAAFVELVKTDEAWQAEWKTYVARCQEQADLIQVVDEVRSILSSSGAFRVA